MKSVNTEIKRLEKLLKFKREEFERTRSVLVWHEVHALQVALENRREGIPTFEAPVDKRAYCAAIDACVKDLFSMRENGQKADLSSTPQNRRIMERRLLALVGGQLVREEKALRLASSRFPDEDQLPRVKANETKATKYKKLKDRKGMFVRSSVWSR